MNVRLSLPPFVLLLCSCATVPPSSASASAEVNRIVAVAAAQVRRCYRAPKVPTTGRRIETRLRVRYTLEGQLATLPAVVVQNGVTPENQAYAGQMAQAASMAVIRCSPITLPPELHSGGWEDFYLTFSPRLLA